MAIHIKSRLDTIMLAIQAQLMIVTTFPIERVLICDPESLDFNPHGDQYLILWPDSEPAVLPDVIGSGRINCQVTDRFAAYVRTRFAVDESSSALKWLTDASLGHIALRHKVWDALIDFQSVDGSDNILHFPILPAAGTRMRRGTPSHISRAAGQARTAGGTFAPGLKAPSDKGWGESILWFDVRYALDLTVSTFV